MIGQMTTVTQAIAPLRKVQANLRKVAKDRKNKAVERRAVAKDFEDKAKADDSQYADAVAILANLNALLATPKKEG